MDLHYAPHPLQEDATLNKQIQLVSEDSDMDMTKAASLVMDVMMKRLDSPEAPREGLSYA